MLAKKKKNLLPPSSHVSLARKSQMQSVVGTKRCREGIQQILSIRFRYGFSSLPPIFFTFFLIIFFLFVFYACITNRCEKLFNSNEWKRRQMFYACSQRQQQQQEQVDWWTEREGRGRGVGEAEQTKCEWCAQVESKRLLATRFSRFTRTLEVIRKLIKQIKYCYEEKAIITHKESAGEGA